MVGAGTGLVGKVEPWLQGELGPLGYPVETHGERRRRVNEAGPAGGPV